MSLLPALPPRRPSLLTHRLGPGEGEGAGAAAGGGSREPEARRGASPACSLFSPLTRALLQLPSPSPPLPGTGAAGTLRALAQPRLPTESRVRGCWPLVPSNRPLQGSLAAGLPAAPGRLSSPASCRDLLAPPAQARTPGQVADSAGGCCPEFLIRLPLSPHLGFLLLRALHSSQHEPGGLWRGPGTPGMPLQLNFENIAVVSCPRVPEWGE